MNQVEYCRGGWSRVIDIVLKFLALYELGCLSKGVRPIRRIYNLPENPSRSKSSQSLSVHLNLASLNPELCRLLVPCCLIAKFLPSVAGRSWCRHTKHCLHNHAHIHIHMGYEPKVSVHTHMAMQPDMFTNESTATTISAIAVTKQKIALPVFLYTTATAPSMLHLESTGITYELVPIFRYYSVSLGSIS